MARKLEKCKITVGTGLTSKSYFFRTPFVYTGLLDETGVEKADTVDRDEPEVSVAQLLATGRVRRVVVSYEEGGKRKTGKLLQAEQNTLDELIGKTYNGDGLGAGGTITSARVPRRAYFQ